MKQITGEKFVKNIGRDASWCLTLSEPLEITTCVDLIYSKITHLSPFLHFKGADRFNCVASFRNCKDLKEPCGTFYGYVAFDRSGVETTKNLKVVGTDNAGFSSSFIGCLNLKILEGEFEGAVSASASGIIDVKAKVNNSCKLDFKFKVDCCMDLLPHIKYVSSDYIINSGFRKKCEVLKKIKEGIKSIKKGGVFIEGF